MELGNICEGVVPPQNLDDKVAYVATISKALPEADRIGSKQVLRLLLHLSDRRQHSIEYSFYLRETQDIAYLVREMECPIEDMTQRKILAVGHYGKTDSASNYFVVTGVIPLYEPTK